MQTFQTLLTAELLRALEASGLPPAGEVVPATDARFGDYQTNVALVLAKQRRENPRQSPSRLCISSRTNGSVFLSPAKLAGL